MLILFLRGSFKQVEINIQSYRWENNNVERWGASDYEGRTREMTYVPQLTCFGCKFVLTMLGKEFTRKGFFSTTIRWFG